MQGLYTQISSWLCDSKPDSKTPSPALSYARSRIASTRLRPRIRLLPGNLPNRQCWKLPLHGSDRGGLKGFRKTGNPRTSSSIGRVLLALLAMATKMATAIERETFFVAAVVVVMLIPSMGRRTGKQIRINCHKATLLMFAATEQQASGVETE